jgi:HEAT repeat protein
VSTSRAEPLNPDVLKRLQHSSWTIRNSAVKALGKTTSSESCQHLLNIIRDRRPSSWWRRCLGEPFYQVGFTRRNAWIALGQQDCQPDDVLNLWTLGMNDPYYEVRSTCWKAFGQILRHEKITLSVAEQQEAHQRILKEQNFEIMIAMLSAADTFLPCEELIHLAPKVKSFKHWRVRAAFLDTLGRVVQKGILPRERVKAELQKFNLRSEYFRPVFMLKEKGAELEKVIRDAAQREEKEALLEACP